MTALPQKEDLLAWVNGHRRLDTVTKYILEKLARFADAECRSWAKIDTLAEAVNKSRRTIQYHLRDLENAGLIEKTGELHRLAGSTRSTPIYQLAPGVEPFDCRVSMGAKIAPIEVYGCNPEQGMGAIGLHPHNDLNRPEEEANASSAQADAREALRDGFEGLMRAYPRRALGWSDPDAAFAAYVGLAEAGIDLVELVGCAQRMADDPVMKRRDFGMPALERWLSKRQFMGWWPEDAAAVASAKIEPLPAASGAPADVVAKLGADVLAVWAPGAIWRAADRTLVVRLGIQAAKFRNEHRKALIAADVRVVSEAELAEALETQGAR